MNTQRVLRIQTTVQDGGQIVIGDPALPAGANVEVLVLLSQEKRADQRSALDILDALPGRRLFKTAEEVDAYLKAERAAWDGEDIR